MKTSLFIRTSVFIAAVLMLGSQSYAADTCDQTFAPQTLRFGFDYNFWDSYTNLNSYRHGLTKDWTVDFTEKYDYNQSTAVPNFAWTQNIIDSGYIVPGNTSKVKVISSSNWYSIKAVPPARSSDNLIVKYHINYYGEQTPGSWVGPISHTECQPYEISWCGDGVKDTAYSESCDDGAANGQPGKCNTSCTAPIPNPPTPECGNGIKEGGEVCDDGTNNGKPGMCNNSCTTWVPPTPINGVCGSDNGKTLSATPVNLCSVGTATAISGKWNWSCVGSNSGSTASCSATPLPVCGDGVKNGTESCDPNDTTKAGWGNTGCNTSCQPTNASVPTCDASKTGVQTSKLTQGYCSNGSVSSFTTTSSGTTETYTWSCNNAPASAVSCGASYTYTPPTPNECDETFTGTLRYGKSYNFYDAISNNSPYAMKLTNFDFTYTEQQDYNLSSTFPSFAWNPSLIANGNVIPSGIENYTAVYTTSKYPISAVPTKRSFDNLKLNYHLTYTLGGVGPFMHNECANYEISWCGDGVKDTTEGEQCDPADPAKSGWGVGGCDSACKPLTTVVTPVCNPAKSGAQTNPVFPTDTLCITGTPSGFVANGTNPVNYTWSCNATTAVNCSATYTPSVPPADFDLRIKKYAKSEDIFASVDKTENFNYTIVVENVGTGKTSGTTTVTDKLPPSVTLRATPSGNGWTCTGNAGDTSFTCTTNAVVSAHQLFDVITVPTKVTNLAFRPDGYVNYAYVQNPNEADGKQCNADNSMPNPTLAGDNGQDPTKVCDEDKNNFDPATINPPNPNGFDLRLKKFVKADDNSAPAVRGSIVDYTFVLQNLGELSSSGRVTVSDEDFPAGITISSIEATQGEWTCVKDTPVKFTCISDKSYAKGEFATTILVKAQIPVAMPVGSYRNIACLANPYDPNNGQVFDPDTGKYIVNNCDPAVIVIVNPSSFDLALKKYVADITSGTPVRDGDHQTSNDGNDVDRDILTIPQGGKARYRFVVTNLGPVTATGTTTVEDTLPNDVSITSVSGTGWNCTPDGNRKFKCTRTEDLAVGASFPQIVVDAQTSATILAGEYSNTATLSNPGDTNPNNNQDPANIQIVVPGFDLSVKKYVNTDANDAQDSANAVSTTTNALINYIIRVKNNGPLSTSGATTVKDVLPTGVSASGAASGTGWLCSYSGADLTCITSQVVASGAVFSDITVPVKVTLSEGQSVTNYAVVYNPDETDACKTDGSMPTGNETSCGKDPRNIDPAVIKVPPTVCAGGCGPGGGTSYVRKTCDSTLPCAGYQSYDLCVKVGTDAGDTVDLAKSKCHPADATGIAACNADVVVACGNTTSPVCGNGVLETGEECDKIGDPSCSSSCTKITTNPGKCGYGVALTIPKLTYAIRSPLIDLIPGQITHRVVVGPNTNVFTLADEIKMNVTNQECDLPIAIKATDEICITSLLSDLVTPSGPGISKTTLCKTVQEMAPSRVDIDGYVRMGKGEYAVYNGGTVTIKTVRNSADPINLFKGADLAKQYVGGTTSFATLRDAFKGLPTALPNATGSLLITKNNPVIDPTGFSDFGRIDVRISGTMLGSTTSVINRRVEDYLVKPSDILSSFLTAFQINGTTATAGNTQTSSATTPTVSVPSVSLTSTLIINKVSDLLPYNLNGNQNIFSIKGNVTIGCPSVNNPFSLSLVRTLIVDGNLIIKCNIAYEADTGASWAFIVKNGNVIVDASVTNLAGVYVAIKKDGESFGNDCTLTTGNTGLFCPQNAATNNILKVDGSMYGNAKPLFDSRLYVRGTSAYDILTTGVIVGYSNRALVNPPPLLSEYLNNYSVTKVTK